MKTVSSISGGKTSAFMALHYPTDLNVFAVVLTDHAPSAPKDPGLMRECQKRIPHFAATLEADLTLQNILDLEQLMGREIQWVAAEYSLDRYIEHSTDLPGYRSKQRLLPNARKRFCTVEQKIAPIAKWLYLNHFDDEPCLMNIGFRFDEPKRVEGWRCENDRFRMPTSCSISNRRWAYNEIEWRIPNFPLYTDRVNHQQIRDFWDAKGWAFPEVSNCRFCFHHTEVQLQRQLELEPENAQWWLGMEEKTGNTFGNRPLKDIFKQPLLDVFSGESCFCHD